MGVESHVFGNRGELAGMNAKSDEAGFLDV
jgi:hypothetical protein